MNKIKQFIYDHFKIVESDASEDYKIICTNHNDAQFIYHIVLSYAAITGRRPHIVFNYKTVFYRAAVKLEKWKMCDVTLLSSLDRILPSLRRNTCLVSLTSDDCGKKIPFDSLAQKIHNHNIPLHVDVTYLIGQYPFPLGVDIFTFSIVAGLGVLGLRNNVRRAYDISIEKCRNPQAAEQTIRGLWYIISTPLDEIHAELRQQYGQIAYDDFTNIIKLNTKKLHKTAISHTLNDSQMLIYIINAKLWAH